MIVESDGYLIDFTDAMHAFKFDETDKTSPTFHGVTALKAVDIIAELSDAYLFIEVKEYAGSYDTEKDWGEKECDEINCIKRKKHFEWLKNYLKYKFRDSYLYRQAENKVNKPIHYICLLNFDNALNTKIAKSLKTELPVGKKTTRWISEISNSCQVMNLDAWNRNFPKWPAKKIGKNEKLTLSR